MNLKTSLTAGGAVTLAVIAGIAWMLWGRRPAPTVYEGATVLEKLWQVGYTATSSGCMGFKPFKWSGWQDILNGNPSLESDIPGSLRYLDNNHNPKDFRTIGQNGRWTPPPGFKLTNHYSGNLGALQGDPRALYTLAKLIQHSGIAALTVGDFYASGGHVANSAHYQGNAVDIYDDDAFNRMLESAKALSCPLAWISRSKDGQGWPMFQLRGGVKTLFAHSSVNHNSHQHLYLPRPDFALKFTKFPGS